MYRVTTVNLSPEARSASDVYDVLELGEIGAAELTILMENFLLLDSTENEVHDPHLVIAGRGGKILVRTARNRLWVYDAKDSSKPATAMSADEILARLDVATDTSSPFLPADSPLPRPAAPHHGIAIAMLIVGLALNGYTLYSVFYIESVNHKPEVTLITDPAELALRQKTIVGMFSTGSRQGDRVILVGNNGTVRFYEIGAKAIINDTSDTYRIGRHEGQLCLATPESGTVDITNSDTLVYYRDTYQRAQKAK